MPFSSTSFWRGLHFAVQKHLGGSLHRSSLYLVDTGSRPQASCLRVAGFEARARAHICLLDSRSCGRLVIEEARGGALAARSHCLTLTPACMSISPGAEPMVLHATHLIVNLRALAWRSGRVWQVPFLSLSFWRGLYLPVQMHLRTAGMFCFWCMRDRTVVRIVYTSGVALATVMVLCIEWDFKHV